MNVGGGIGGEGCLPPAAPSSLVLPLVLWGTKPPNLHVNVVRFLGQGEIVLTGSEEGVIILWRCASDGVNPHLMLTGHTASITALSPASLSLKSTRFVSASADGEVALWDWQDGRSVDSVIGNHTHTYMLPHWKRADQMRSSILICSGEYNDLVVLDANDLTTLFCLYSRVEPDWMTAFAIIARPSKAEQCIGLSMAGMIKIWPLTELDRKDMNKPLYEDESKRLNLSQVKAISFSSSNPHILVIVCEHSWLVVDLDDLSVLASVQSEMTLSCGHLIDGDKAAIAANDGTLRIYRLPASSLRGSGSDVAESPLEFARLDGDKEVSADWLGVMSWCLLATASGEWMAARVSPDCSLLIWRLPIYDSQFMQKLSLLTHLPLRYRGTYEQSLENVWKALQYKDENNFPNMCDEHVTSSLYIGSQGRLLLGMRDGFLVIRYICEALSSRFLLNSNSNSRNGARAIRAHRTSIRSLVHPHSLHRRFDPSLVLSGGDDFAVCIWQINTATRLFRFAVNGGPVTRFLVPPDSDSKILSKCVVALADDHSVSLLNVRDCKCILLATRHTSPVIDIRFRPADDYMLVRTLEGDVFVWQMETGSLERVACGMAAEDMMAAAEEAATARERQDEAGATQAVQLVRAIKHRNLQAVKKAAGQKENVSREEEEEGPSPSPLTLAPLLPGEAAHLVLFDVAALINALVMADAADQQLEGERKVGVLLRRDSEKLAAHLSSQFESTLLGDLSRVLLSLLHAWQLDDDLDTVALKKLHLQPIEKMPTFASAARTGHMCIFLPRAEDASDVSGWCVRVRWQLASSLTTLHLLAAIALYNTLMTLKSTSWIRTRRTTANKEEEGGQQQSQCGWSVAIAFHLVLFPSALRAKSVGYAPPRLELLARRWQDECVEVRHAAQALLNRELSRIEESGRRRLIDSWAPFLPPLLDPSLSIFASPLSPPSIAPPPPIPPRCKEKSPLPEVTCNRREEEDWGVRELRRKQATAIVLLAVVGGDFGDELQKAELTRVTAQCLLELLLSPPSPLLPSHSPLRRAAIDLLGRGFPQWEPHLEISKVLLGLLSLASSPVPSSYGRLCAAADAQRTARLALSCIGRARAPALLAALSCEVARFNSAAQHQTIQHTVTSPLLKSRFEVLRLVDELSSSNYSDVVDMMLPLGEVLVHCLDASLLKHKTLSEIFPPITKFGMVAYCASTRRIAFGGKNGKCVVHDLRACKSQTLHAHSSSVSAASFSEDGKFLATYASAEGKLNFWQTSQSFLGMGQSTLKCAKTQAAPLLDVPQDENRPRLVWISQKAVTLLLPDGKEHRFAL